MELIKTIITLISIVGAYLVGAFPSGYVLARLFKGVDIRQHGSGNIGASNAARVLGKHYFVPIFLLDACKAWGALALFSYFNPESGVFVPYLVAFALLLGNAFSIFLRFTGGKGVATSLGIIAFFYSWPFTFLFACSWLGAVIFVKPFLASFFAFSLFIFVALIVPCASHKVLSLALVVWMICRHLPNIKKWK